MYIYAMQFQCELKIPIKKMNININKYFLISFLMWVFDRWSPYSYQNNRNKYKDDEEKREFNLKECLWFCMTSLTPQVILSI